MGLDMHLYGRKTIMVWGEEAPKEDGFELAAKTLELGYWRKHPNLHGFIVDTFADGEDNCQEIFLDEQDLQDIITAIEEDDLPYTEGFFFGESPKKDDPEYAEQKKEDLDIIKKALDWVKKESKNDLRQVVYQASW